ncbi:MAG: FAD-binding oxidoreductase [Acidiferrobacterales bacterium]|nr:FAD-binding oxidoreductase [Acidiferrobacterales bacterium]
MSPQLFDYLIVGQGLAGSLLAHQLIKSGKSIRVIDNSHQQSASQVAAGIINPITGPRLTLTENFREFYPKAEKCYANLEQTLDVDLWQTLPQHRLIKGQTQTSYYRKRSEDADYINLIGQQINSRYFPDQQSIIEISQNAIVDTKLLIKQTRNWLIAQDLLDSSKLDYQSIKSRKDGIALGDQTFSHIIFCEGFQAINNPWLSHLPFKLSKGEILTIDIERPLMTLLNWGNWLAPIQGQTKLGSSYTWGDLNLDPSNKIRDSLLSSLSENTNLQGRVISQEVGIRPTTRQRLPFIGPLKNLKGAYCFNGFGSKGCLLVPHYADLFCQYLLNNLPLDTKLTQWL